MKLQDLDKTKRYDLSECTDEELLCVLNWLKENDNDWYLVYLEDIKKDINKYHLVFFNEDVKYVMVEEWSWHSDVSKESIKPTFIQENKQDQFLNELQELCKKYDADILFTDTEIRQSTKITVQIETENI